MGFVFECLRLFLVLGCTIGLIEYNKAPEPKDPVRFIAKQINQYNSLEVLGDNFEIDPSSTREKTVRASSSQKVSSPVIFSSQSNIKLLSQEPTKKIPWPSISLACKQQNIEELQRYYDEYCFDVDKLMGERNTTHLYEALKHNHYVTALWLLEKGATVSKANGKGKTCWKKFYKKHLKSSKNNEPSGKDSSINPSPDKQAFIRVMISRGKDLLD